MTGDQLLTLWAFARGDLAEKTFEKWYFDQPELEEALGRDFHWALLSANYADRDEVWKLRKDLATRLARTKRCECPAIRDVAAIPMGGDNYFQKVFEPFERVTDHGQEKWWLYIDRCKVCASIWLVAQDDRIYDDFFLARIDESTLLNACRGEWPERFTTYESVLAAGRQLSTPPRFFDPMSKSLQWSVEDLLKARPDITNDEIAYLLGLSSEHALRLVEELEANGDRND